ncbi:hypothetical protein Dimus_035772, partial [Dionaea muscipula]
MVETGKGVSGFGGNRERNSRVRVYGEIEMRERGGGGNLQQGGKDGIEEDRRRKGGKEKRGRERCQQGYRWDLTD